MSARGIAGCSLKKAKWGKGIVEWIEGDTAYLSVVFSWDFDAAYSRAVMLRHMGYQVRVGGPGVFVMGQRLAGVAEVGGSIPDTVIRHNPMATFASRGCDVGCWFCIVPAMEGRTFTLIPDFQPRPILCDNNLSALPGEYQDHIIDRYQRAGVPLLDANSGFEPQTFDDEVYARWRRLNRGPWRFAYDELKEGEDVRRVLRMLKDLPASKKRVYVLIGNEQPLLCLYRIHQVIAWGGEPHVQPVMKLNARQKQPWVRKDLGWTAQSLRDMARWANRWIWRKAFFREYRP